MNDGEGDRRWKIPCICDTCEDYYRNILTNDEEMVDRFSIMARNRKTIGKHKDYDPNTKCVGDILVKTPIDTHKEKKKRTKKAGTGLPTASDDPSDIDIKWTSENMIKTKGYANTIIAFDKYYGDFPNMGMKSAIPNILLYGPPGTGKSIAVRSLVDKYPNFVYRLLTANDIAGDLKEIPGLLADLWTELSEEAQTKDTRGIFLIDELGSIGDSRKTSVKSTKKATETLISLMDGLLCPGNVSVIAAANDTETIDPAILDRFDECVYYMKHSTEERINFLLVYTDIDTPVHRVPMEDINVPELRVKLAEYTMGLDNGRVFRKLRRDYNWWYIKFKKPNIVTNDEFLSYLREFTAREDKKRNDMDTHNKESIEKKGVGRPVKAIDGEVISLPKSYGEIYREKLDFLIANTPKVDGNMYVSIRGYLTKNGILTDKQEKRVDQDYDKLKELKEMEKRHQTGFTEDGSKVEREKPVEKKVENKKEEIKVTNKEKVEQKVESPKKENYKDYNLWCIDCGVGPFPVACNPDSVKNFMHCDFDNSARCLSNMRYEEKRKEEQQVKQDYVDKLQGNDIVRRYQCGCIGVIWDREGNPEITFWCKKHDPYLDQEFYPNDEEAEKILKRKYEILEKK